MSKIDRLIQEFCPEGVEYKKLGDIEDSGIIKLGRGSVISKKDIAAEPGDYPIYSSSASGVGEFGRYSKYMFDDERLSWSVDGGGRFFYRPAHKYSVTNVSGWLKVNDTSKVSTRYLYYALDSAWVTKKFDYTKKAHPSVIRNEYKIAIPPIQIQKEIVDILDKFTQLEAELSARRLQHAHYWNYLLAPRETWKTTTLGEVARVFDGPHATPKKTVAGPWYLSISSLKDGRVDLTESAHLSEDEYPTWIRRVAPRVGDTLFSYETRVGQAAYWDTDEPAALGRRMGLLRPNVELVHPRFLTLLYLGPQFQKLIQAKTVKGSTVDRIPIANMASWEVIIPSLNEQAEIVRQVDAFDALVNDLKVGLPAELTARRKQYEYYRTKLLTFQEITV